MLMAVSNFKVLEFNPLEGQKRYSYEFRIWLKNPRILGRTLFAKFRTFGLVEHLLQFENLIHGTFGERVFSKTL